MKSFEGAYSRAYSALLYPTWQRVVRRRPIGRLLGLLQRTEWLDAHTLAWAQTGELRDLLAYAGTHVPYYRELFARTGFDSRAVRSREDLAALPRLTRDIVRDRYEDLVSPELRGTNVCKQTSGTTGAPLRLAYCNTSEAWRQAVRLRAYAWAGYHPGVRSVHYWGTGGRVPTGLRAAKTRVDRFLRREVYVDCARQDEAAMRAMCALLGRLEPSVVIAFTRALAGFSRWCADHDARTWADTSVICGAEAMMPADRAAIVASFGPRVFETYGGRETMLIACECEAHEGMHVAEENLIVEILRDDGSPAKPGETGALVVTDLHNYGMPFIRYANGDLATWLPEEQCRCGRWLRRLASVDGRVSDTLRNAGGAPVPGIVFHSLLNAHAAEIREFQAVQRRGGQIELRIVPGGAWSESRFAASRQRLASYFEGLPFEVKVVDAIARDPSGKQRSVVVET